MNLTNEQQAVVDHIAALTPDSPHKDRLLLVSAVAGSGKSHLLKAVAATIPHTNGLVLAYNKSIATESKKSFPKTTSCITTHSLAYQAVVNTYKLKVGFFSYKSVTENLPYSTKCDIVDYLREFCLSSYLSFDEFAISKPEVSNIVPFVNKYLELMESGAIEVTHDFYLKMFHILLSGNHINYPPFDFVLLDEAGDVNPVTQAIFQLLPTNLRIAVGDPHQNIYGFNHTVNCFDTLADLGTTFHLSKSFRVPDTIAVQIEAFCKRYLNPNMEFKGVPVTNSKVVTRAFISRTNSSLIGEMIKLNSSGTPYSLVRKAAEIFALPIMVTTIKPNSFISNPQYSHIQKDVDEWFRTPETARSTTNYLSHLSEVYSDDISLVSAIRTILSHGRQAVMDAYFEAKKHESTSHNYILTTVHSSKGLQFDEVTLADDLNNSISPILDYLDNDPKAVLLPEQREPLSLYYVAVSRTKNILNNATILDRFKPELRAFQSIHYPEQLT